MESQQVGDAPQNVQVHPNNEFLQYMQINADFMNGLSRQLDTRMLSQEYIIFREIIPLVFGYG